MSDRPQTMQEAMAELGDSFRKALPLDRADLPAFAFWTVLGYLAGGLVALVLVLATSLTIHSAVLSLPCVAGVAVGARLWWHLRNLGNE